jgi:hypothetical protein
MRASESPDLDDYLADGDDFSADQDAEADFFDCDDGDNDDWDDGPYSCRDIISN